MIKFAALLFAGSLMASAGQWTGWFTCSNCKEGNASSKSANRECAESCIKGGAEAMFVTEDGNKLFKLPDNKLALANMKTKVKVTGTISGDKLTISKVEKAE